MTEKLKTNVDLLKASQEAIQELACENNRAILLTLDKSEGKDIKKLQAELKKNFGIHKAYVEVGQLESLEKTGLVRHTNTFETEKEGPKKKYVLAPAGIIAVDFLKKMTKQYKPLDINITPPSK